jgi:hypothetical protein
MMIFDCPFPSPSECVHCGHGVTLQLHCYRFDICGNVFMPVMSAESHPCVDVCFMCADYWAVLPAGYAHAVQL